MRARSSAEVPQSVVSFLDSANPTRLLIGGTWVDGEAGSFPSYDPARGEAHARVSIASEEDVRRAVEAARSALRSPEWSDIEPQEREALLYAVADRIEEYTQEKTVVVRS